MDKTVLVVITSTQIDSQWLDFCLAASSLDIAITLLFKGAGVSCLTQVQFKKTIGLLALTDIETVFIDRPTVDESTIATKLIDHQKIDLLTRESDFIFQW